MTVPRPQHVPGLGKYRGAMGHTILTAMSAAWKAGQVNEDGELTDLSFHGNPLLFPTAAADLPVSLTYEGRRHLYIPSPAGNTLTAPHSTAMNVTDFSIIAEIWHEDWRPAADLDIWSVLSGSTGYDFQLLTDGTLRVRIGDGVIVRTLVSSAAIPNEERRLWVRVDFDADNGSTAIEANFYTSTNGVSWVQLGAAVTGTPNAAPAVSTAAASVCSGDTCKLYYAAQLDDMIPSGGGVVVECNPEDDADPESLTFTDGTTTWTIARATADLKTVVVEQDLILFGSDDHLYTPDFSEADIAESGGFTIAVALRRYGNAGGTDETVASKDDAGAGTPAWALGVGASSAIPQMIVDDATNDVTATSGVTTDGVMVVLVGVRDPDADDVIAYTDTTAGAAQTDPTTATMENDEEFWVGGVVGGTKHGSFEFYGAALANRVLTASELSDLVEELKS